MIGSLHGPMNEENLNGCMAPILAGCPGLNFNNDIQIPYRFPIVEEVHDGSVCTEKCWQEGDEVEQTLAAQTQQNAQAGYAADYQNKRSAQSFNEVKEAKRGPHALADKIHDKTNLLCWTQTCDTNIIRLLRQRYSSIESRKHKSASIFPNRRGNCSRSNQNKQKCNHACSRCIETRGTDERMYMS